MKRSIYMMSLILSILAGHAVQAAAAGSETAQKLRKTYPTLSAIRDRYNVGYPLLMWGDNDHKDSLTASSNINVLMMTLQDKPSKQGLRELDAFMQEYSDELSQHTKEMYDFYRPKIAAGIQEAGK